MANQQFVSHKKKGLLRKMVTYPKLSPLLFYDQRRDLQKRNSSTNREVCCPSYKKQPKDIALLQML